MDQVVCGGYRPYLPGAALVACAVLVPAARFVAAGMRLALGSRGLNGESSDKEVVRDVNALQQKRVSSQLLMMEVASGALSSYVLLYKSSEDASASSSALLKGSLAATVLHVALSWELWFSQDDNSGSKNAALIKLNALMGTLACVHAVQVALLFSQGWKLCADLMSAAAAVGTTLGFVLLAGFSVPQARSLGGSPSTPTPTAPPKRFVDAGGVSKSAANDAAQVINNSIDSADSSDSALRENIQRKGENSYYYAHAKTPTQENFNRGGDPVRLQDESLAQENLGQGNAYRSIRDYAFSDGSSSVTVYVDLSKLDLPSEEVRHEVEFTSSSVRLVICERFSLNLPKLAHDIKGARSKLSSSGTRLSLILKKEDPSQQWAKLIR